jgi:membrane-bound lytic murein transglycosylase A
VLCASGAAWYWRDLLWPSPAPAPPPTKPPDRLALTAADFASVPGWSADRHAEAIPALLRSCAPLGKLSLDAKVGTEPASRPASAWQAACAEARGLPAGDHEAARRFFEAFFVPHATANNDDAEGLFTGYYEPELAGCRERTAECASPLLRRPPDLVTVELGRFRPAWRGERIAGKVEKGALVPYASRAEIERGALDGKDLELAWAEDPIEVFFLQIQGSGRVRLADGSQLRVGYDGQNGHAYVALGRVLIDRGLMPREQVTMQSIKAYLRDRPHEAAALMNENPSYVFFRELSGEGPVGAQGVALTPGRSLAVDRSFLPLGAPVWLVAEDIARLLVAQDTGGAIRGPVRGDVFWGHGAEAEARAGAMKAKGRAWLLLPRESRGLSTR